MIRGTTALMIRDLLLLPGVPRRMMDDISELKELVRELLVTEHDLTDTSRSMNSKMDKLDEANRRLDRALDELHGFNEKLGRLDARMAHVEREMAVMRGGVEEIAGAVPTIGRGPLEKAKDALTGS
jgi:chromosome segregation ATPase